jgi:DNA-binding MarR family transcriptional regulator
MHAVSFVLKRAHLQNVAFGKKALKKVPGMTPARFDLLYLLRRVAIAEGPSADPLALARRQTELWKDLGLHRSTVAKMLSRLEELGWIRRERDELDRRTFVVALTKKGLRLIWRAMRRVFRQKIIRKEYERLFRPVDPSQLEPWEAWAAENAMNATNAKNLEKEENEQNNDKERHVVSIIHDVYCTVHKIARHFGDCSAVWYDLGAGLPKRLVYALKPLGLMDARAG